jgi:hypothetical protein
MKDLKTNVSNMQPAFRDAGEYLKKETLNQFDKEVDPDGKAWEPLKPSTLLKKKSPYKLRETLTMFNTLYYTATKDKLDFGIKDKKYIFHHEGTSRMPARVVIGITNERMGEINKFVLKHIRLVGRHKSAKRKK